MDRLTDVQKKGFNRLLERYHADKGKKIDWESVVPLSTDDEEMSLAQDLPMPTSEEEIRTLLNKLVVLKLNGGLGTSMGCTCPKSTIEIRGTTSFLDLIVKQLAALNTRYGVDIPLVLMNSFSTQPFVDAILPKYKSSGVRILCFLQNQYPRIHAERAQPLTEISPDDKQYWYPPGHGDVLTAFVNSGLLQDELDDRKFVFISNADNLGATVDLPILNHFAQAPTEFLSEQTPKTLADVKGGALIKMDGTVRLLETAQVPAEHMADFCSIDMFTMFNTNNIWIKIDAMVEAERSGLELDVIVNRKSVNTPSGPIPVIQLETAVGAAVSCFNGAGVSVPRTRFLPVKTTNDLLLLQSDVFEEDAGRVTLCKYRRDLGLPAPLVRLGDKFKTVSKFAARFGSIPSIRAAESITVKGDVTFGRGVEMRGTVIIIADEGKAIHIPAGSKLENAVVTGTLKVQAW